MFGCLGGWWLDAEFVPVFVGSVGLQPFACLIEQLEGRGLPSEMSGNGMFLPPVRQANG